MNICEDCNYQGEFVVENYGSSIITFCPNCYKINTTYCDHKEFTLVKYLQNGNFVIRTMCSSCYEMHGSFVKKSEENISKAITIDKKIYDADYENKHQKYRDRYNRLSQFHQEWEKKKWLQQHNDYLNTPEWRERREEVLKRDSYLCQACLKRRASHVHHLSYKHWTQEPLFELVSVCKECHDKITEMDRNNNNL